MRPREPSCHICGGPYYSIVRCMGTSTLTLAHVRLTSWRSCRPFRIGRWCEWVPPQPECDAVEVSHDGIPTLSLLFPHPGPALSRDDDTVTQVLHGHEFRTPIPDSLLYLAVLLPTRLRFPLVYELLRHQCNVFANLLLAGLLLL